MLLAIGLLVLSAAAARGQGYGSATLDPASFPTLKPIRKTPAPPPLTLETALEIPIPGPLAGGALTVDGDTVQVPVIGGYVLVDLGEEEGSRVTRVEAEPPVRSDDGGWILTGKKKRRRFRTEPEGRIMAQKRASLRSSVWKRRWSLRTPGSTPAPPLLVGKSILFGCSDNRVYSLKARNGHRQWYQDLGHRIQFPLVHWHGGLGALKYDLVLVVPHPGRSIRVLDPFDGQTVARFQLGQGDAPLIEDEIVSHPATLPDGRIVLPVQKYASEEAVLLVLKPEIQKRKADDRPAMPYNGDDPAEAGSREGRTKTQ
ncbi:MAG: PQQ-binding-like beta-propeller repeat protein [Acidobacteria bacterium]|uniref:PQQ-binding-like beta-propeller repeat protein n=1 Tax=Candidatus Polarisedimenticola svalbardensis TaxID=2886004 RepID=A0A8J6XX26_9BACT|nr:PQQ-binding-like beta-propeller repeat protein [Candidatus Polarisedimenticola svalbardensis]